MPQQQHQQSVCSRRVFLLAMVVGTLVLVLVASFRFSTSVAATYSTTHHRQHSQQHSQQAQQQQQQQQSSSSPTSLPFQVPSNPNIVFPAIPEDVSLAIVVFPGDVVGLEKNDRKNRLQNILDTWGVRYKHQKRFHLFFVKSYFAHERDQGAPDTHWLPFSQPPKTKFELYRGVLESLNNTVDPSHVLFVHDHTFVIVENLICFVKKHVPAARRIVTGSLLQIYPGATQTAFISDAAGSVFTRGTIQFLLKQWHANLCLPGSPQEQSGPQHLLAKCRAAVQGAFSSSSPSSRSERGIELRPALDEQAGAELFNVYGPVRTVHQRFDAWFLKYKGHWMNDKKQSSSTNSSSSSDVVVVVVPDAKLCCSAHPISFHYTDYVEAAYLDAFLHSNAEAQRESRKSYPTRLGGYAVGPSSPSDPVFEYLSGIKVGCM